MPLIPLSVSATWPAPNYVNPASRGPALLRISIVLTSISVVVVGLRAYVRKFLIRKLGWDDWLMFLAMVPTIGTCVAVDLATQRYSWDKYIWDVPPSQYAGCRKVSFGTQFLCSSAAALARQSLLCLLLRFAIPRRFRQAVYVVSILNLLWILFFMFILGLQCRPLSDYWDVLKLKRNCLRETHLIFTVTGNLVLELAVYILPMPVLWNLVLPLRQRIALVGLFAMGSLAVLGAAFHVYWVVRVTSKTYDLTWEGYMLWLWTAVEINLSVICATLPTLKPLVSRFLDLKRPKPVSPAPSEGSPDPASRKSLEPSRRSVDPLKAPSNLQELALHDMDINKLDWACSESFEEPLSSMPTR